MSETRRYEVVVSPKAEEMLLGHVQFLGQVSIGAGERLLDEFENRVESLEALPSRGSWFVKPYIPRGKYRWIPLGEYLQIVYQIAGDTVFIELIIDTRAENKPLFNMS